MKVGTRSRKKPDINLQSQSFSLSNAKTYLGRLIDKAGKGETVYIMRGARRFILQEVPPIDPIPFRPAGYFGNLDSKEEIQEANKLSKTSIVRAPKDLE